MTDTRSTNGHNLQTSSNKYCKQKKWWPDQRYCCKTTAAGHHGTLLLCRQLFFTVPVLCCWSVIFWSCHSSGIFLSQWQRSQKNG